MLHKNLMKIILILYYTDWLTDSDSVHLIVAPFKQGADVEGSNTPDWNMPQVKVDKRDSIMIDYKTKTQSITLRDGGRINSL